MSTIAKIAYNNDKKNKTRSILIMISIFLTTMLLTVICTYAYGLIKFQKANAAAEYGSHYGTCLGVDMKQLQEMRRRSEFVKLGLSADAGIIDSRQKTGVIMVDPNAAEMSNLNSRLVSGTLPGKENEIAAQAEFFEHMGYEHAAPGDKVLLPYRSSLKEKYREKEFVVSGIIETREMPVQQKGYTVYTSPAFYDAQFTQEEKRYSVMFQMAEGVLDNYDEAETEIVKIVKKCGINGKKVSVNNMYLLFVLDPGYETMSGCGMIAVIVVLLSIVVIYNIFQVGIVQKIQEYGKIRALGATKKQMRRLIFDEGMYLAAGSIPLGTAVGFVLAWISLGWVMRQGSEVSGMGKYQQVSVFSFPVLLLAALLAFLTVCAALARSMRIAARISPIEAVRYQENTGSRKAGFRKGRKSLTVTSMAFANVAADRRRTIVTILTMGLSCVLFVILANCVGNIDSEYEAKKRVPYGRFQIELDYSMQDEAYPENNLDAVIKKNPLNQKLIDDIYKIPGVESVRTMDILLTEVNGRQEEAAVIDEDYFNWLIQSGGSVGTLNYADSQDENVFYYCWSHFLEDYGYSLNQQITMTLTDGTDTIEADGALKGSFGSAEASWAITKEQYERMGFQGASTGWLWVDCEKRAEAEVRQNLEQLLADIDHVEMSAYKDALENSKYGSLVMRLGCYLFLAIIGLIGFMNLANTMIMNIITKKQEYGILQAVGMTNRQLNASLQLQGLLFTVGIMLVSVITGLPAGYGIFLYARENSFFGMNVYHIPVLEIVWMAVFIGLLQIGLSYLLSRNLKKESLVERIRYQG